MISIQISILKNSVCRFLNMLNTELSREPATALLGICPRAFKIGGLTTIPVRTIGAALFT